MAHFLLEESNMADGAPKSVVNVFMHRRDTKTKQSPFYNSCAFCRWLITQVVRPRFSFRLSSFFFPRSVTNRPLVSRAHASLVHAHGTWNFQKLSSRKASSDSMISRAMKSHTNEHTVRGRPTLKVVKRFRNVSVCKAYERTFWVNLSMLIPKELSTGAINSSTR